MAKTVRFVPDLIVYTDGASRGNPGPSGAGWVIQDAKGKVLEAGNVFLGTRTNNEAEYAAVIYALTSVLRQSMKKVLLRADSELLVRQITGIYQVRSANIKSLFDDVVKLSEQFQAFHAEHVPRENNKAADEQANLAIDKKFRTRSAENRP